MERTLTTRVCDFCGQPAVDTAKVKFNGGSLHDLDLCAEDKKDLRSRMHPAKKGKRPQYLAG